MLVDVNLPIFGCKSNPCVTLHPKLVHLLHYYAANALNNCIKKIIWQMSKIVFSICRDLKQRPINFLTGVDLYLDQSMCNAPEALLCWHLGGYVKVSFHYLNILISNLF